jgi:hypothetical protein
LILVATAGPIAAAGQETTPVELTDTLVIRNAFHLVGFGRIKRNTHGSLTLSHQDVQFGTKEGIGSRICRGTSGIPG